MKQNQPCQPSGIQKKAARAALSSFIKLFCISTASRLYVAILSFADSWSDSIAFIGPFVCGCQLKVTTNLARVRWKRL